MDMVFSRCNWSRLGWAFLGGTLQFGLVGVGYMHAITPLVPNVDGFVPNIMGLMHGDDVT